MFSFIRIFFLYFFADYTLNLAPKPKRRTKNDIIITSF
ncbi:hypothetical protein HMPREF1139_0209 [Campylobacter sp. FOBRC14]|nr:hypothetical protein HMPREF1139_0209 [Campylobacter sp. FOBRC14]